MTIFFSVLSLLSAGPAIFLTRLGFVLFELVAPQRRAEREARNVGRRNIAPDGVEDDVRGGRFFAGQQAANRATEIEPVLGAIIASLIHPHHHQARKFQLGRREQIDGCFLLALETADLRGA